MGRHKKSETQAAICPIEAEQLTKNFDTAKQYYARVFKKLTILDAVDRGRLWEALRAKMPAYQILSDSNWISYIKQNLLASIYCVTKSASILPTCDEDKDIVENINIALDYIWDSCGIGYAQMEAGSRAALLNLGITQVGWDADYQEGKVGSDTYSKGNAVVKNIDPLKFMRDPFAVNLDSAGYCMTWDDYHKTVIMDDPRYRENFKKFLEKRLTQSSTDPNDILNDRPKGNLNEDYFQIIIHFVMYNDNEGEKRLAEIHTVSNQDILYFNADVQPTMFPFVELYCNLPEGDIVGTSEPSKVLSNNIAYNILNSIILTSEYKNQRPPRYVSSQSGINLRAFKQSGNEADMAFIVNGDASRAVHYQQFPVPSQAAQQINAGLLNDIQMTTGVDGRYTGRDTGSVITTGGVEDMLNRVTLIDTPKIANYERYCKKLTQLILANFVEFGMKRTYFKKDTATGKYKKVEVDYDKLQDEALLHYSINISSELPKNKQRVAAAANMLMEKQLQYGSQDGTDLITTEEWLELQDLPIKELMMKRMNLQRMADINAEVADTVFGFAGLVKAGLAPDDAMAGVAQNLMAARKGEQPPVEIPAIEEVPYDMEEPMYPEEPPFPQEQPQGGFPFSG